MIKVTDTIRWTENMNEQFEVSWLTLIAQCVNFIFVILFLSLPFILWSRFKKREAKRDKQLDKMQDGIDELKNIIENED